MGNTHQDRDFIFAPQIRDELKKKHIQKKRIRMPSFDINLTLALGLGLLGIAMLFHLVFHSSFTFIGGFHNPISLASTGHILDEDSRQIMYISNEDLSSTLLAYKKLQDTGVTTDAPLLDTIKQLERSTMDYGRILRGIENSINRTVATNNLFKQIDIGTIIATKDNKQITLENVKITLAEGEAEQTPVALAAAFVENLERSAYFKDVESSSLTSKITIQEGVPSKAFTPLSITMTYQAPLEPSDGDEVISLEDELTKLLEPITQEHNE